LSNLHNYSKDIPFCLFCNRFWNL